MNLRRILPIEVNLVLRNLKDYIFQENVHLLNDSNKPRCYFLDAASYDNLGDQAIALSMTFFLRDIFGVESVAVVNETDLLKQFKSIKSEIKPSDIIVLSGGGNMGDKYPRYEAIRRKVIKGFPNNKIIIFPQTIDYTDDRYGIQEKKRSKNIYAKHDKLIVCARENNSYREMRRLYSNVIMAPDIVFTLGKSISLSQTKKKYSIGVCLRDDNESSFSEEGRKQFISILSKKYRTIKKLTTMCKDSTDILKEEERQQYIMNILYDFSECNLIITDRLHGMIFSVLSNVPCCVIDNLNHKVSGVFKTIQGCSEGITLCRDMHFDGIFENLNSKTCRLTNMDDKYKALYECLKG